MSARLATVLQQETTLRVESPSNVRAVVTETDRRSAQADDADRSALAKEITRDLGVNTVLVSRVTGSPSHLKRLGMESRGFTPSLFISGESRWPFTLERSAPLHAGKRFYATIGIICAG